MEDGQTSDVSIIAHGRDDDNMEIGLVEGNEVLSVVDNNEVLSMLSLTNIREELIALLDKNSSIEGNVGHFENMDYIMNPLGLNDRIRLLDENNSRDGTPPATSIPLT